MTDIIHILKSLGYSTVPASFYGNIAVWKSWYDGNVGSFHRYQVYNGLNRVDCRRYTMGMAKKVAEDWANLLLNETSAVQSHRGRLPGVSFLLR